MKKSHTVPFMLRLVGYSGEERTELNRQFAQYQKQGGSAFHAMHEDNLLDPDLYLVHLDRPGSVASLERLRPAPARPALVLSGRVQDLPHLCLQLPKDEAELVAGLEQLVQLRANALARLPASEVVHVSERRRQLPPEPMPDALRSRRAPLEGGVLVVDREPAFAQMVAQALAARGLRVDRANEHRSAVVLCKQFPVALVVINTATPGLDPYKLCEAITTQAGGGLRVIFLVGRYFSYLPELAHKVGCEGFVSKPLLERQLDSLLRRYLPSPSDADG